MRLAASLFLEARLLQRILLPPGSAPGRPLKKAPLRNRVTSEGQAFRALDAFSRSLQRGLGKSGRVS